MAETVSAGGYLLLFKLSVVDEVVAFNGRFVGDATHDDEGVYCG